MKDTDTLIDAIIRLLKSARPTTLELIYCILK